MPKYVPGVGLYADGVLQDNVRIDQQGAQVVTQLHADGYEQAVRRNTYMSTSIARATSLVSTTMVGHILWNPPDSGVNASIRRWASSVHATSATATGLWMAVGYQATTPTGLTAVDRTGSTYLTLQGAAQDTLRVGRVRAYAAATLLVAPVLLWLCHHNTAAIATTGVDQMGENLEGSFILPPGGILCFAAQGAAFAAASHSSSFLWNEVPVTGVN
jgi:hypothetical protein